MPIPGRLLLRPSHQRRGTNHRPAAGPRGRHRTLRARLRLRTRQRRQMDLIRDRTQPTKGRDDASVPDLTVPHRRPLRSANRSVSHRRGPRETPRRDRPPPITQPARTDNRRSLRHRRPPPPSLRPGQTSRRRLPHDLLPHRTRKSRADRRRKHRCRSRNDLPTSRKGRPGRGTSSGRPRPRRIEPLAARSTRRGSTRRGWPRRTGTSRPRHQPTRAPLRSRGQRLSISSLQRTTTMT